MYIYLGPNKIVRKKDIVAIFDLDTSTVSLHTRNFLSRAQREKRLVSLGLDLPKSFVVMRDETIYLCPFNVTTLSDD